MEIDSTVLTCYVMGFGALYFIVGGLFTGGIRLETDGTTWLCILSLALYAPAVSNMTLVQAIKRIGPTLTSIFGAMEPLTAVVIGVEVFGEPFTMQGVPASCLSSPPSASLFCTAAAGSLKQCGGQNRSGGKSVYIV